MELIEAATEASAMGLFQTCPNEILYDVFSRLDARSLGKLAQVNSTFRILAEGTTQIEILTGSLIRTSPDGELWRPLYISKRKQWNPLISASELATEVDEINGQQLSWKAAFVRNFGPVTVRVNLRESQNCLA